MRPNLVNFNFENYSVISPSPMGAQTREDKRAIINRAKTLIKNLWAERRDLQKEKAKLKAGLKKVSKKKNKATYDSIANQIADVQKKITRREEIIHCQIEMVKNEVKWLNHLKEQDRKKRSMMKAYYKRLEMLDQRKQNEQ